ncbi:7706_t:CDS:2, partial [Scutellospora calospora]
MPKWYNTVIEEIRSSYIQTTSKSLVTSNLLTIQNTTIQKYDWIYTKIDNQYIIGRLTKILTTAQIKLIHWIPNSDLSAIQCKRYVKSTNSHYGKEIKSDIEDVQQALQEERLHILIEKQ